MNEIMEKILNWYCTASPINYDYNYIQSQIDILRERSVTGEIGSSVEEKMMMNMIFSLLKYYIRTSITVFQTKIVDIVVDIEQIYHVDGLLEKLIEKEDEYEM